MAYICKNTRQCNKQQQIQYNIILLNNLIFMIFIEIYFKINISTAVNDCVQFDNFFISA